MLLGFLLSCWPIRTHNLLNLNPHSLSSSSSQTLKISPSLAAMEFWGVEVKPGQTVKCDIEEGKLLHLSQAALGESKKGVDSVPIFVKFNDQKLVVGTLSQEKCAQIQYDLVFEKEFELSHSSKNASVYFCGYKTVAQDDYPSGEEDFSDSESEEEMQIAPNANGKVVKKEQAKTAVKEDNSVGKAKVKKEEAVKVESKANDDDEDDEDDDDDDDDSENDSEDGSDDELPTKMAMGDSDDDEDDEDESSEEEEEATPKKAAVSGKRPAESAAKTPTEKKAKLISPAGQKTGGSGKKGAHIATPHPAKGGKTSANSDKSKQQTPKSAGSATCKPCSKSFNSDNALQAHNKAKHSAAK